MTDSRGIASTRAHNSSPEGAGGCAGWCAPLARAAPAVARWLVGGGGGSERRRVGGVTEPRALRITLGELRLQLHELRSNRSRAGRVGAGGWSQATSHTGIPCCNRCACRQSRSARVHVEKHRAQHCLHQFPPAPPQPARINSLCSRSRHRRSRDRRRRQDAARSGERGWVERPLTIAITSTAVGHRAPGLRRAAAGDTTA